MTAILSNLKRRLSTIHVGAWHYRLYWFAFGWHGREPQKACLYWWAVVPSSFLMAGLKLLFFAVVGVLFFLLVVPLFWIVSGIGWFFGFRPTQALPLSDEHPCMFYGYKVKPGEGGNYWDRQEHGKRAQFAPYQLVLPVLAVVAAVFGLLVLGGNIVDFLLRYKGLIAAIALGIAALYVLGVIYTKIVAAKLKQKYQEWCPDITWVYQDAASLEKELVDSQGDMNY